MLQFKWMDWDELLPYLEQLIELEIELTQKYHYPDMNIPRSFAEDRVKKLETHMKSGNTFFWVIIDGDNLLGYYWAYISIFINIKRWNLRSLMFRNEIKGQGYGILAIQTGLQKAIELGCDEVATDYVPWNKPMAQMLEKNGYRPSRIEVVKKLK